MLSIPFIDNNNRGESVEDHDEDKDTPSTILLKPLLGQSEGESLENQHLLSITTVNNVSDVETDLVTFAWNINQWRRICPDSSSDFQPLRSPLVPVAFTGKEKNMPSRWFFELRKTNPNYLSLFLCEETLKKLQGGVASPSLQCYFKLMSVTGEILLESDGETANFSRQRAAASESISLLEKVCQLSNLKDESKGKGRDSLVEADDSCEKWKWNNFLSLGQLFDDTARFFPDNTLRFEMNIKFMHFSSASNERKSEEEDWKREIEEAMNTVEATSEQLLADDVSAMCCCGDYCDLLLHCDNANYPIHKPIIYTRCRKLYHMLSQVLSTEVVTKQISKTYQHTDPILTNSATISDVDADIFRAVLEFIYKGRFTEAKDLRQLELILQESVRFELENLKALCFLEALELLTEDTFSLIVVLANNFGVNEDIKAFLSDYYERHEAGIKNSDSFSQHYLKNAPAFRFLSI